MTSNVNHQAASASLTACRCPSTPPGFGTSKPPKSGHGYCELSNPRSQGSNNWPEWNLDWDIPPEKTTGQQATFDLGKPAGRSYPLRKIWCRHWRHPLTFINIHHHSHPQYHHHPHHHIPIIIIISHVSWFNLHLPIFPHCQMRWMARATGMSLLRFLPEVQHDLGAALLTKEVLLWSLHDFVGMS